MATLIEITDGYLDIEQKKKKICRAILLYKQLSGLVELPVGTIGKSFIVNVSFKLYYRDVELCQGIWALNRGWVLYFMIYICVHTSVSQRDNISLNIYFSYHQIVNQFA